MSSSSRAPGRSEPAIDPENRYLWRMNAAPDGGRGGPRQPALPGRHSSTRRSAARISTRRQADVARGAASTSVHSHDEADRVPRRCSTRPAVLECYRRDREHRPAAGAGAGNSPLRWTPARLIAEQHRARSGRPSRDFVTAAFEHGPRPSCRRQRSEQAVARAESLERAAGRCRQRRRTAAADPGTRSREPGPCPVQPQRLRDDPLTRSVMP